MNFSLSFLESDVKSKEKENQEKTSSGDLVPSEVNNVANDPEVKGDSDVKGEVEKNKGSEPEPKAGVLSDSFSATSDATQENYFAAALTKSDGYDSILMLVKINFIKIQRICLNKNLCIA